MEQETEEIPHGVFLPLQQYGAVGAIRCTVECAALRCGCVRCGGVRCGTVRRHENAVRTVPQRVANKRKIISKSRIFYHILYVYTVVVYPAAAANLALSQYSLTCHGNQTGENLRRLKIADSNKKKKKNKVGAGDRVNGLRGGNGSGAKNTDEDTYPLQ